MPSRDELWLSTPRRRAVAAVPDQILGCGSPSSLNWALLGSYWGMCIDICCILFLCCTKFRFQRARVCTGIMENQAEKNIEDEMEAGVV